MAVEQVGKMNIDAFNDANVPVDVWLSPEEDEDCQPTGKWELRCDNYMPRKGYLAGGGSSVCRYRADTREELAALVAEKVLPLYREAVAVLEAIVEGTEESLYYWQRARRESAEEPN